MMTYRTLLIAALVVAGPAAARRLPHIYWNSSSSIFDISTSDHVMQVEIGDQVSFVCPEPGPHYEFTQLYMVSDEEYNHCELRGDKPKLLGACKDASHPSTLSIVFRKYSPLPGGLEFVPGHTYHVISTSDGSLTDFESRKGGLCASAQMKIKFEVEQDRHHHKTARHDDRSVSPKFAARMTDGHSSPSSSSSSS
ncbi:hypothetical protein PFISCL1PPCAC_17406, partial [Pristionchus fissidentatus]